MTFARRIGRKLSGPAMAGASLAVLGFAIASACPAQAQSFDATYNPTFALGNATISTSPGGGTPATPPTTTISLGTTQTVIDWIPNDKSGTGTINFQPAGTVATFQPGISASIISDYTVLNRIVPVDASGAVVNRPIAFNGLVQSFAADANAQPVPGGSIWFYSPTGIIVGSTATFNVGSLVLTTNPIDITGGLVDTKGHIRFGGAAGSNGYVQILSGAKITTQVNPVTSGDAYVAVVAPRIEQGGTINADGPVALVAAEQVDIGINAGLFDIQVTQGTTDTNGIVHTGSTGGATTVASGAAPQVVLVAVPKNDGMTMLLSGNLGYTPATAASTDGGAVILSAGNGLGYDFTGNTATGKIAIGNTVFTSTLTANATDAITVTPTTLTQFQKTATLNAGRSVSLTATGGASIDALAASGLSLDVHAGSAMTGGTIAITSSSGSSIIAASAMTFSTAADGNDAMQSGFDATGGTITVNLANGTLSSAGLLTLNASGIGGLGTSQGGVGTGGTVTITAAQGSVKAGGLDLLLFGSGGDGTAQGGNGFGGSGSFSASQGATIDFQSVYAAATGAGGFAMDGAGGNGTGGMLGVAVSGNASLSAMGGATFTTKGFGGSGLTAGGNGTGGSLSLSSTGGLLGFGDLYLDADSVGGGSNTAAGSAFGGNLLVSLSGTNQNWNSLYASADTTAGGNQGSTPVSIGGSATGDTVKGVSVSVTGVALAIANTFDLGADTYGSVDANAASLASAGRAMLSVTSGGSLSSGGAMVVSADAGINPGETYATGSFASALKGGTASVTLDAGTLTMSQLAVTATAQRDGATTTPATVTGGSATLKMTNGSSLSQIVGAPVTGPNTLVVSADAVTNRRTALATPPETGSAVAGTALLQLDSGQITTTGGTLVSASGIGTKSINGGSNGTGGSASLAVNGGTFAPGTNVTVTAEGVGGSATGGGASAAGTGTGGSAAFTMTGGTVTVPGNLTISADGGEPVVDTAVSGAGTAVGGSASLAASGGSLRVTGNALVVADGTVAPYMGVVQNYGTNGLVSVSGSGMTVGGYFVATSLGSLARSDGRGANVQLNGSGLTVAGDARIGSFGDAIVNVASGTFSTAGMLELYSSSTLTATGLITSGSGALIGGDLGLSVSNLSSGGTTYVQAFSGPATIGDLKSTGAVTALANSVDIGSTASLTFASATAKSGNLSLHVAGNLALAATSATGTVTLQAGGTLGINDVVSGTAISATSSDIAIATAGRLGVRGTTTTVTLVDNAPARPSYLGGAATSGGYSLDANELTRVFANNAISLRVANGASVADTTVGDLSLAFGSAGNIGTGGTLLLTSPGRIAVTGNAALTADTNAASVTITAPRFDIVADTGSLAMSNAGGAPAGTITVSADTFAVATAATLARLDPTGSIAATNTLLDTPGTAANTKTLYASSIVANVVNGIYVQNLGTTTAYADRRGFTADPFAINTAGAATQIVINGVMLDAAGTPVTGLGTAALIDINGTAATTTGTFNPASTINGCVIGVNCNIPKTPDGGFQTKTDLPGGIATSNPFGTLDLVIQPIEFKEIAPNPYLPLVDEPVTGVGNEDLWGSRCDPDDKPCKSGEK